MNLDILIVEDEKLAFIRLKTLIENADLEINSISHANSISEACEIIKNNDFSIGLFDIELSDGLSFEIFNKTKVNFPVIFTTGYNQYVFEAFKYNSIQYLLKPVKQEELNKAFDKFFELNKLKTTEPINTQIADLYNNIVNKNFKKRFTVKIGEHIIIIDTNNITLIYSFQKGTYIQMKNEKTYLLEKSLDKMHSQLNPELFFRINRKEIICIENIKDIIQYKNSRLKIIPKSNYNQEIIVSRERVSAFKNWIGE